MVLVPLSDANHEQWHVDGVGDTSDGKADVQAHEAKNQHNPAKVARQQRVPDHQGDRPGEAVNDDAGLDV